MSKRQLIMVVDDDQQLRDALSIRLSLAGFDVATACNAAEGIDTFRHRQPHAAILDVQLPGIDGFAVCEHIRSTGSNIPVLFLTGASEGILKQNIAALTSAVGANYYMTKPFDGKAVVMILNKSLARKTEPAENAN